MLLIYLFVARIISLYLLVLLLYCVPFTDTETNVSIVSQQKKHIRGI